MATKINDLPTATRLLQALGPYSPTDESLESATVDLIDGDGPAFAIISIGEVTPTATLTATLQTSANGTAWEDVDGGAIVTTDIESNSIHAIAFQRKLRYVRILVSIFNNSLAAPVGILIGQGRKQI